MAKTTARERIDQIAAIYSGCCGFEVELEPQRKAIQKMLDSISVSKLEPENAIPSPVIGAMSLTVQPHGEETIENYDATVCFAIEGYFDSFDLTFSVGKGERLTPSVSKNMVNALDYRHARAITTYSEQLIRELFGISDEKPKYLETPEMQTHEVVYCPTDCKPVSDK